MACVDVWHVLGLAQPAHRMRITSLHPECIDQRCDVLDTFRHDTTGETSCGLVVSLVQTVQSLSSAHTSPCLQLGLQGT